MAERIELESEPSDGDGTDGRFICPYCHDYQGKNASVKAHIRAKTDPAHKGKSGYENESEPVPGTEPDSDPAPSQTGNENQNTEPEEEQDWDDDSTVTALVIGGMVMVLLWIAQRTGNRDALVNEIGNRTGDGTSVRNILEQ